RQNTAGLTFYKTDLNNLKEISLFTNPDNLKVYAEGKPAFAYYQGLIIYQNHSTVLPKAQLSPTAFSKISKSLKAVSAADGKKVWEIPFTNGEALFYYYKGTVSLDLGTPFYSATLNSPDLVPFFNIRTPFLPLWLHRLTDEKIFSRFVVLDLTRGTYLKKGQEFENQFKSIRNLHYKYGKYYYFAKTDPDMISIIDGNSGQFLYSFAFKTYDFYFGHFIDTKYYYTNEMQVNYFDFEKQAHFNLMEQNVPRTGPQIIRDESQLFGRP
ncbi:MAG: hypothetical protein MJB14_00280, partial [Spirochaetes bacterium]|nr:hypothetical protein [Spirochaetota bacterium]